MKNKSQSNLFFSLFLFAWVGFKKEKRKSVWLSVKAWDQVLVLQTFFPCFHLVGIPPTPCWPHFWNPRAPFAGNVLSRPMTLMTDSLVTFSGRIYAYRSCWSWEKTKLFVMCFNVDTNPIMWKRQPSESTLQSASGFFNIPQTVYLQLNPLPT